MIEKKRASIVCPRCNKESDLSQGRVNLACTTQGCTARHVIFNTPVEAKRPGSSDVYRPEVGAEFDIYYSGETPVLQSFWDIGVLESDEIQAKEEPVLMPRR